MLRKQKYRCPNRGGTHRVASSPFFSALLILILLGSAQGVGAAGQTVSGITRLGNNLGFGTTSYSVTWAHPSIAQVGSNLTISVTLKVDNLTGQIDYILQQRIIVDVFVASAVLNGSVIPAKNATNLYSGSTWGPFNITLPLTETNTGLAKGASTNATVSVTLEDTVLYATPSNLVSPYGQSTEPAMQGSAGSLIVQNQVSSTNSTSTSPTSAAQTYLPYALLGSGVVLMLLAVFLPRGSRGSLANEKQ